MRPRPHMDRPTPDTLATLIPLAIVALLLGAYLWLFHSLVSTPRHERTLSSTPTPEAR